MIYLLLSALLAAVCSWFFAMLAVDCWRDNRKNLAVVFGTVSFILGVSGVLIWILR